MSLPIRISCVLILFVFSCQSFGADQSEGKEWIREPPPDKPASRWDALPQEDIYEVVASKEFTGVLYLTDKPFIPLKESSAKYFTGHYYRCEPGKKAYLIRAVCGEGGTGHYTVSRKGDQLFVFHESLGKSMVYSKSVIVVNLDFVPKEVYASISIAE